MFDALLPHYRSRRSQIFWHGVKIHMMQFGNYQAPLSLRSYQPINLQSMPFLVKRMFLVDPSKCLPVCLGNPWCLWCLFLWPVYSFNNLWLRDTISRTSTLLKANIPAPDVPFETSVDHVRQETDLAMCMDTSDTFVWHVWILDIGWLVYQSLDFTEVHSVSLLSKCL